jgi:hypothetical protein
MKTLLLLAVALSIAVPAHALQRQQLRVDRPQKGSGAQVTSVQLIRGLVPHRMRATVLTDTRCTPDRHGVSHCLNRMRLANGRYITVVHNHRMMYMPCLSPGERVVLTP